MRNESRSTARRLGHSRVHRARSTVGSVAMPAFPDPSRFYDELIKWGTSRSPIGAACSEHKLLMDNLTDVISHLLDVNCSPCASRAALNLLIWIDGTGAGNRSFTSIKVRLVDPQAVIFSDGVSPVTTLADCFFPETQIPLEYQQLLVRQLDAAYAETFYVFECAVSLKFLILTADNKQLGVVCGVQGNSTSQRCSQCNQHASLFVLSMFGGEKRTLQRTATDAVECARMVLDGSLSGPAARLKFNNVRGIPLPLVDSCQWPLDDIVICPPLMHNTRNILSQVLEWILGLVRLPVGGRTLLAARELFFKRLLHNLHMHSNIPSWNTTQFRAVFAHWPDLLGDLLPSHSTLVPMFASGLSFLLYSAQVLSTIHNRLCNAAEYSVVLC